MLFVAGGLGLAPLRPAILSVLARRSEFGQVVISYGARSPADILFRDELERWRGRFDVTLEATVDHSGADWYGPVGVDNAAGRRSGHRPRGMSWRCFAGRRS